MRFYHCLIATNFLTNNKPGIFLEDIFKEINNMDTLKEQAISAISTLPDTADIDDIMYRLYVIDKVTKGRNAIKNGHALSTDELKKEIESW